MDLSEDMRSNARVSKHFGAFSHDKAYMDGKLDIDGFPFIGTTVTDGDPFYRSERERIFPAYELKKVF